MRAIGRLFCPVTMSPGSKSLSHFFRTAVRLTLFLSYISRDMDSIPLIPPISVLSTDIWRDICNLLPSEDVARLLNTNNRIVRQQLSHPSCANHVLIETLSAQNYAILSLLLHTLPKVETLVIQSYYGIQSIPQLLTKVPLPSLLKLKLKQGGIKGSPITMPTARAMFPKLKYLLANEADGISGPLQTATSFYSELPEHLETLKMMTCLPSKCGVKYFPTSLTALQMPPFPASAQPDDTLQMLMERLPHLVSLHTFASGGSLINAGNLQNFTVYDCRHGSEQIPTIVGSCLRELKFISQSRLRCDDNTWPSTLHSLTLGTQRLFLGASASVLEHLPTTLRYLDIRKVAFQELSSTWFRNLPHRFFISSFLPML
jgi:hypothetical protein